MMARATIFALSSGLPPAAIAVIRISGPNTAATIAALAGKLPPPRRASMRRLKDPRSGLELDQALVLWFPGPATATGEDLAELHLHGGRAVVHAVLATLAQCDGLREARPGEYTRRAFENGRIDLNEAEGLADLLFAETEAQRRSAIAMAEGHFSGRVAKWQAELLKISALVEAELDFSDEDDVPEGGAGVSAFLNMLRDELAGELSRAPAERLRDGIRVVLAGPPNSGKSTLLNALAEREAAIVSPVAGTTRDRIEVPVAIEGVPFVFTDTAGIREETTDEIEGIGVGLARRAMDDADLVLWMGPSAECPDDGRAILLSPKCDLGGEGGKGLRISALSGWGMEDLRFLLVERARTLLPRDGEYALNKRQRDALRIVHDEVRSAALSRDCLILAEHLRGARAALDAVTGKAGTENMLDALFGSFCIGK